MDRPSRLSPKPGSQRAECQKCRHEIFEKGERGTDNNKEDLLTNSIKTCPKRWILKFSSTTFCFDHVTKCDAITDHYPTCAADGLRTV